jgi:hypothetical protein
MTGKHNDRTNNDPQNTLKTEQQKPRYNPGFYVICVCFRIVVSNTYCFCFAFLRLVYSMQHYMIKFDSDLRQIGDFLRVLRFPTPVNLTDTI